MQLRLAALDKRLEAHQQAYTLWRKLIGVVYMEDQIHSIVMECQDWWEKNWLYLEVDARVAFPRAYLTAVDHHSLLKSRAQTEDIKHSWEIIMLPGKLLVKGVELPSIAEDESPQMKEPLTGT